MSSLSLLGGFGVVQTLMIVIEFRLKYVFALYRSIINAIFYNNVVIMFLILKGHLSYESYKFK